MAGMNNLSMRPGFARGLPARLPWMNVYSKPDFVQKYNVLPDISRARKETEDDLEENMLVSKVDVQHEYSGPRTDVGMKELPKNNEPNIVRRLENSAEHFEEGIANKIGRIHYGHESRIGSVAISTRHQQELNPMKFPNKDTCKSIIGSKSCIDRTFMPERFQDLTLYGNKSVLPCISRQSHVNFEKPAGMIKRAQSSYALHVQEQGKPDRTQAMHTKVYKEPEEFIKQEMDEENPSSVLNKDHSKTEEDSKSKSADLSSCLISDNKRNDCRKGDDVELGSKLSYSTSSTTPEHQNGHITIETEKWAAFLTEGQVEKRNNDDINDQNSGTCTSKDDNEIKGFHQGADNNTNLKTENFTDSGKAIDTAGPPKSNFCNTSQSQQSHELMSSQAKCNESFTQRLKAGLAPLKENACFEEDFPEPKEGSLEIVYEPSAESNMQPLENKIIDTITINNKTEKEIREIKDSDKLCAEDRHNLKMSTLNHLKTDEGGPDKVSGMIAMINKPCQRDEEMCVVIVEKQVSDIPSSKESKRLNTENCHSHRGLEKQKVIVVNPESVQRQHRKRKSIREDLNDSKVCIYQNEASSEAPISQQSGKRKPENDESGQCEIMTKSVMYETDDDIDNISDGILDESIDNNTKSVEGRIELTKHIQGDFIMHDDTVEKDRNVRVTDNSVDVKPLKKVTFANEIKIYDIKPEEISDMEQSESAEIQIGTEDYTYNTDSDIDQISDRILDYDNEVKINYDEQIKNIEHKNTLEEREIIEIENKSVNSKPEDIIFLGVERKVEEESRACTTAENNSHYDKITQDDVANGLGKHKISGKEMIRESKEESRQKKNGTSSITPVVDTDFHKFTKKCTRQRKYEKSVKSAFKNKSNDKSIQTEKVNTLVFPENDRNHDTFKKNGYAKKVTKPEKSEKKLKNRMREATQQNENINTLDAEDKGWSLKKHEISKAESDKYMKKIKIIKTDGDSPKLDAKKNCTQWMRHEHRFSIRQNNNHVQNSSYCYRIKSPVRSEIYMKIMNILETKIGRNQATELMRSDTIKDMLKTMTKEPMRYGLSYAYIVKFREENIYLDLNKLIEDPTCVFNQTYNSQPNTPASDWNYLKTDINVAHNQTTLVKPNPTNINHSAGTTTMARCDKEMKELSASSCVKNNNFEKEKWKKTSKLKSFFKKFLCVCSSRVDNDDEL